PLGGSGLGRHLRFDPRLEAGRRLHVKHQAKALMDISDGLAWDVHRLSRASGLRARLLSAPIHREAHRAAAVDQHDALWHALHDGEDHELIAALAPAHARRAVADRSPELAMLSVIGKMEEGRGVVLDSSLTGGSERRWNPTEGGWRHGG
ncbi:MAG: hypothetical protein HRU37_14470, partial [Roseibacillus sp.]|nr:hypothetical protein [Roseibacillus sp.]